MRLRRYKHFGAQKILPMPRIEARPSTSFVITQTVLMRDNKVKTVQLFLRYKQFSAMKNFKKKMYNCLSEG